MGAPKELALIWTPAAPTEDGWYWYRCDNLTSRIVYVAANQIVVMDMGGDWETLHDFSANSGSNWAGPIPLPLELDDPGD